MNHERIGSCSHAMMIHHEKYWLCFALLYLAISRNTCVADSQDGLSSSAIIGIAVGAVSVFLLFIGIFAACFIFGLKGSVFKPSESEEEPEEFTDIRSVSLPADIPIEALNREPPPRYTPRVDGSNAAQTTCASRTGRSAQSQPQTHIRTVQPPPYYSASSAARRLVPPAPLTINESDEIPPAYRSRVSVAIVEVEDSAGRTGRRAERGRQFNHSMDSFTEFPSMSDVLLTSSRSSLPAAGLSSHGASRQSRSERSDNTVGQVCSQSNHSTREDRVRRTNRADGLILGVDPSRGRSTSLVNVSSAAAGTVSIPDGGLRSITRRATRRNLASIDESHTSSSSAEPSSSNDSSPSESNPSESNSTVDLSSGSSRRAVVAPVVSSLCSSDTSSDASIVLESRNERVKQIREAVAPVISSTCSSDTDDVSIVLASRRAREMQRNESNDLPVSSQRGKQLETKTINSHLASRNLQQLGAQNEENRKRPKVIPYRTTEV